LESALATAYVSFCKPVNVDTATGLIKACRETLFDFSDKDKKKRNHWDKLRLMMSSGGGNVMSAFAAYNELRGMPIEIHTFNTGATDSSALMIFMTGKRRYACARSAFLFHQMTWSFSAKDDLPLSVVSDAARWLKTYQGFMADAIAEDSKITREECLQMMHEGTTLTAQEALDRGLIHEIAEPAIPADARWWQV
jgi:ATP-dependent protease ClpP protease subunit